MVKSPPASAGDTDRRHGFDPWAGKIPWRREWPPTPLFLPGESHGQRSLAGYSPWCRGVGHSAHARARAHTHTSSLLENLPEPLRCPPLCSYETLWIPPEEAGHLERAAPPALSVRREQTA